VIAGPVNMGCVLLYYRPCGEPEVGRVVPHSLSKLKDVEFNTATPGTALARRHVSPRMFRPGPCAASESPLRAASRERVVNRVEHLEAELRLLRDRIELRRTLYTNQPDNVAATRSGHRQRPCDASAVKT
jgi:hypothetical protein